MRILLGCLLALAAVAQEAPLPKREPAALEEVLERMAEGGKRRFVFAETVAVQFRERKVRTTSAAVESSPWQDGIELLRTAGLAVVALPNALWRVVPEEEARNETLPSFEKAEDLPVASEFCQLVVALQNVGAREIQSTLQSLVSDSRCVTASEEGNVIYVRDYAGNLRGAAEFLKRADAGSRDRAWQLSVVVLAARDGAPASAPKGFDAAKLEKATRRNQFSLVGDGVTTISVGNARSGRARGMVKLSGDPAMTVEMTVLAEKGGPVLEPLNVSGEKGRLLEAKVPVTEGEWVVAGTVPTESAGELYVVLVKGDKAE